MILFKKSLFYLLCAILFDVAMTFEAQPGGAGRAHRKAPTHQSVLAGRRQPGVTPQGMTRLTITGSGAFTSLGRSVTIAGDLNGDGYDDLVVGGGDESVSGGWKVYIFFGGPAMDTIPDLTLKSSVSDEMFGISVAYAGDLNGDGYDDLIVGAYNGNILAGPAIGKAYIFFGGPAMDSIPDVILVGEASGDGFGRTVACAGDVNGDGYPDVIVAAPYSSAAGLNDGRALIYFGGAVVDSLPDVIITGSVYTENLGNSVAGAGDVNGDGYDDVIIGAWTNDLVGGNNGGKAYLYLGGPSMDNVIDLSYNGIASFDYFGVWVAGVGDVNGDGYDDLLITARGVNARGRVALFYGGASLNTVVDLTLNGEAALNYFGDRTAPAGDINGDGHADLIVAAEGYNNYTGKVYVYFGGASMDTVADMSFTGEAAGDRFGSGVAGGGDLNGDGFPDIVVGAYRNSNGGTYSGRVYVYLSSAGPLPIRLTSFTALQVGSRAVRLNWMTLSEVNNYGFEIQRRRAGDDSFVMCPDARIPGHGTTNVPCRYQFEDSTAPSGEVSYRLKQIDLDGSVHYSDPASVSVHDGSEAAEFSLEQNYPNPFNPTTLIGYQIPAAALVTMKIYDIFGREVTTLVNETKQPGHHTARFDGSRLASGVYFCSLHAGLHTAMSKLLLLR